MHTCFLPFSLLEDSVAHFFFSVSFSLRNKESQTNVSMHVALARDLAVDSRALLVHTPDNKSTAQHTHNNKRTTPAPSFEHTHTLTHSLTHHTHTHTHTHTHARRDSLDLPEALLHAQHHTTPVCCVWVACVLCVTTPHDLNEPKQLTHYNSD